MGAEGLDLAGGGGRGGAAARGVGGVLGGSCGAGPHHRPLAPQSAVRCQSILSSSQSRPSASRSSATCVLCGTVSTSSISKSGALVYLSLIHISEPTRQAEISY